MLRTLFHVKENRDAEYVDRGGKASGLKKTSIRAQRINPKYVADSGVQGPTAFGDELEFFPVLYSIEESR